MTARDTDVFWIESGALKTCASTSCAAPTDLATGVTSASSLVTDDKFVYWIESADSPNGSIRRVAR